MSTVRETPTRQNMIKFLADVATAETEDDVNRVLGLFEPAPTRSIAGQEFSEVLGYNPIEHWDIQDMLGTLDKLFGKVSRTAMNTIQAEKQAIAERAMSIYDAQRETNITRAVVQALAEFVGDDDANKASLYLLDEPFISEDDDDGEGDDDEIDLESLNDTDLGTDNLGLDGDDDFDIPGEDDDDE